MSKYCQQCGNPLGDGDRFCGNCGKVQDDAPAYQEPVTQPAYQEPVAQPVAEAVPYQPEPAFQPVYAPSEQQAAYTPPQPSPYATQPASIPQPTVYPEQQSTKPKKSKKGLIIGISAAAVVVIAAVVLLIVLLGNGSNGGNGEVKKLAEEYKTAYNDCDWETYYKYDFDANFRKNSSVKKAVEEAKEYGNKEKTKDYNITVQKVVKITGDDLETMKDEFKDEYFKERYDFSPSDIQEMHAVYYKESRKNDNGDLQHRADVFYAIKVDGEWYFKSYF